MCTTGVPKSMESTTDSHRRRRTAPYSVLFAWLFFVAAPSARAAEMCPATHAGASAGTMQAVVVFGEQNSENVILSIPTVTMAATWIVIPLYLTFDGGN